MKIKMRVKIVNTGSEHEEEYNINNNLDPLEYAEKLISNFNETLRPGESSRKLIDVKIVDKKSIVQTNHQWEKQNLFTITGKDGLYDNLKCVNCGITAKRYGFNNIIRDKKYKAKIYNTCEGAIAQLKRLKK